MEVLKGDMKIADTVEEKEIDDKYMVSENKT
jgi:hypothetical protein